MAHQDIVDFGFDYEAISTESKAVVKSLTEVLTVARAISDTKINVGTDNSFATLKTQQQALQVQLEQLTQANVDYINSMGKVQQSNSKAAASGKELTQSQAEYKLALKSVNADTTQAAKETLGLVSAYDKLVIAKNKATQIANAKQAEALIDPSKKAEADALSAKANALNQNLKTIDAGVGNYQRNVGNYTGAINTLKTSLDKATASLEQMKVAGNENTAQGQQLQKEVSLLSELVGQQSAGFTSLSREIMNTGKALETMRAEGLGETEAFRKLETEFANGKRSLMEFRNEQKILTSQAPALSALTVAAKGLAGAYGVGVGAVALLGDGHEKLAEHLNQLVAVMTILQGLEEVERLIKEKSAIATALFGTATVATTTAIEGETVALDAATVSTGFFTAALEFLAANPIVLILTAAAAAIVYFTNTTVDAKEALKSFQDHFDKMDKAAADVIAFSKAVGELDLENLKQTGAKNQELHDKKMSNLKDEQHELFNLYTDEKNRLETLKRLRDKDVDRASTVKYGKKKDVDEYDKKHGWDEVQKIQDRVDNALKATSAIQHQRELEDAQFTTETLKKQADDERALTLQNATNVIAIQKDKNAVILANDKSTFEQRVRAIKSNTQAEKDLVNAELASKLSEIAADPSKGIGDEKLARSAASNKINELTIQGGEQVAKEVENNAKRIEAAQYEITKSLLNSQITANDEIVKNTHASLDTRLVAYGNYARAQQALIDNEEEERHSKEGLNAKEIEAIDVDIAAKRLALAKKNADEISKVILSSYDETKKSNFDNSTITALEDEFKKVQVLNDKFKKGKIDIKEYNIELAKIKDAVDIIKLTAEVSTLNDEIASVQNNPDINKDDKDAKIAELTKELDALKLQLQNAQQKSQVDNDKGKLKLSKDDEIKLAQDTQDAIFSIIADRYEREKNLIQDKINLLETQSAAEIQAVNNSTLNQQQKAAELQRIEISAAAQKAKLVQQQRKANIEEAKFEKASAILKIIENIGIAISKGNLAEAIAGGIQLAVVAAKPIPTYAMGGIHGGGPAIFGEAGKELVEQPGKAPFVAYKPTLMDLAAGTKLTPLKGNELNDYLFKKSMASMDIPIKVNEATMLASMTESIVDAVNNMNGTIKKQKAPVVVFNNTAGWHEYIKRAT